MTALFIFCIVGILACIFATIRNNIVFDIRILRIKVVKEMNLKIISQHDYTNNGSPQLIDFDFEDSYDSMLWDVRKWTYKDFFPNGY